MAQPFPYTYYSCDCYDSKTASIPTKRSSQPPPPEDEDERTFDPRNPRSNYSLYPLEHLLYCEDCQQIRCPRCVIEETLNWFCPSCLFEVPSSMIKSEGNRCTRNCYNCPVCTSPMMVNSLEPPDPNTDDRSGIGGPWVLSCPYCHWSTVDIGIEFEKHTGITQQLSRIANGGKPIPTQKERDKERDRRKELESKKKEREILSESDDSPTVDRRRVDGSLSHEELFSNLSAFYKSQIASATPSNPFSPHDINFSSPSSFSRIMNLYSSTSSKKQKQAKPTPMREAASTLEGLTIHDSAADATAIERIKKEGWSITLSSTQKHDQLNPNMQFDDELRPVATLLRTKRGKRCRNCRHILSKPESKITSTRYKIKLLALNHIPRLSLRALSTTTAQQNPTPGTSAPLTFDYNALKSGIPTHFLLTLSNPLFDPIRVTLATPSTTPGKIQSRITILCPQFEVGANTDVWDDALSSSLSPVKRGSVIGPDGQIQGGIEAGKIWDRGRNWTRVVIEIVPGFLKPVTGLAFGGNGGVPEEMLNEDEDVLEIPIFVRLEFEADVSAEDRGLSDSKESEKDKREKREEAFWTVIGVGRIAAI
ncbi:dynactin Arp1 p62 subunit RO2 [Zopfia rhizophila CBS 207.26]|uniref:Dynactin subunit 4 n=1 Tax=Zopfia rhizophila CBS 207.26 TaxID=1314779 RepID=A0A6A6DBH7_9PEZI|nr:dynactin Arp1 p62 subunit RO2 [Zopfia rhizophila CBS 207.26]